MAICEISEDAFEGIINGSVEGVYLAIVFDSVAIHWLASDDHTAAGVVRRDRDGTQVSYSWGAYRGGECVGFAFEVPSEYDAFAACMGALERSMLEVDR